MERRECWQLVVVAKRFNGGGRNIRDFQREGGGGDAVEVSD